MTRHENTRTRNRLHVTFFVLSCFRGNAGLMPRVRLQAKNPAINLCRVVLALLMTLAAPVVAQAQTPPELVWAGDSEGGAPYVEADPARHG